MKSEQKLLTIGEITQILGLTRRIVLNYEAHGLIKADTRGEFNAGYRYYSMDTLVRIRTIRTYQNLGLSLAEIKSYLNGGMDLIPVLRRMEALREELDLNINHLRERIKQEQQGISIKQLPPQTVYSETVRGGSVEMRTKYLRDVAYTAITRYGTDVTKRMYFTESDLEDQELVSYCAIVPDGSKGEGVVEMPPVKALVKYHHGSYEKLPQTREELLAYAAEKGLKLTGRCRCVYLEGPPQHKDPHKFITMVALFTEE